MADEQHVTIPAAQLAAIQGRLAQLEGKQAADAAAQQIAQARALIQAGRTDEAVAAYEGRIAEIESRTRRYAEDAELRQALGAHDLASAAAAEQLHNLLRGELAADPDPAGGYRVRTKDYRPVAEMVRERLARPEYAHFLPAQGTTNRATAGGHTAGSGTSTASPREQAEAWLAANPNSSRVERSMKLGELRLLPHQGSQASPDEARTNMSLPFGLRRHIR